MGIYNLSEVVSATDGPGAAPLHGFNIMGSGGRPLVGFSFETQEEAETARKAMEPIISTVKLVKPQMGP